MQVVRLTVSSKSCLVVGLAIYCKYIMCNNCRDIHCCYVAGVFPATARPFIG